MVLGGTSGDLQGVCSCTWFVARLSMVSSGADEDLFGLTEACCSDLEVVMARASQ